MITLERITAVLFAACLVLLPLPGAGKAGCRAVIHHRHQQQAAVVFQPVYQQPYWYSVGANLQIQAIVQETIKQQLALQAQPQQIQSPCPDGTCPTPQPQTLPLTAAPDRWALVRANCASCHTTNADAMAAIDMTDLSLLTCEQKLACMAAMLDNKMPKGKSIDPQTFANILGEFSGAETAHQP